MIRYNAKTPLRCFFAFEGYNSQGLALNRLKERYPDFEWVCVGRSEIDRYAITAANALFPESADKNFGDITRIDWSAVPDFDLFTWSFPCQSLSVAGRQAGMAEGSGTASSLAFECMKAIETKRPKFCVMENVKALTQQKFANDFNELQRRLMKMGYANFWQVLNAKNYGVPQNRERVFMVSIRIDSEVPHYEFPRPIPLTKCIADIMEPSVDESYYLTDEQLRAVLAHCDRKVAEGCGFKAQITPPPPIP
jgi:DNA (cytosine-5)-methyltransferase 1